MTDPQEGALTDLATGPITEEEIDSDLLAEAQRHFSAHSSNAAINEALRRLVEQEREKRRAARARLNERYEAGAFDFSQLDAAEERDIWSIPAR
ncbi:type II toxin-antitoxin system VapB family antitoxin [Actinoplanes auranticolor]|uniref:type II toxin-antitoxin system VapB family antitoxin n=1 Tax=Actinoplanes auranticolor TaxID=47988 RepID=UPI001BB30CA0|nr:type II toxin-antitoxin system VapB family antitoxin [Actinoplanes auranticolor]